ncbi:Bax inhibitor-1/YccA family protein [Clostridium cellulovorans]|uniref:Inner membrane protein YbhL n=1 Tax=Clostridium cellulovorans (strain ATCC 35296 / DSM 3052 / OCM 3 / 743B) TaxID=573061 RepID=D9SL41_CLOC7|nr:Bax inhibitor-1/YccA family protein [Clostridium cellulovorans]ADL51557.1 protein of unknown function UPF0005 [Clostridium cellulovorans 743B]
MERNQGYAKSDVNTYLTKVYGFMTIALIITSLVAYAVSTSNTLMYAIYGNRFNIIILFVCQIALVIAISRLGTRISTLASTSAFILYSIINGLTISYIFIVYASTTIFSAFFVTAGTFAAMSLYGYVTKKDLTTIGRLGFMALIGIILASLVNGFLIKSSGFDIVISIVSVIVFIGLIAYDTQKLKQLYYQGYGTTNIALIGALTLYLDFINLFLNILRLFGGSSRD